MGQLNHAVELSAKLRGASERKAIQENRRTAKGELKSYTPYRLAKETKIDPAHAYRILHGDSIPSREILIRICKALGCSNSEIHEIFNETEYRTPDDEELAESNRSIA